MNDQIAIAMLGTALAACVIFFAVVPRVKAWADRRSVNQREIAQRAAQLNASLDALNVTLGGIANVHLKDIQLVPEFLKAHGKALEALVVEIAAYREAVEQFRALLVKAPQPDIETMQLYDAAQADHTFLKHSFMAEGRTEQEAALLADQEQKKILYSNPTMDE